MKRLIAILSLLLALCTILAACGEDDENTATTDSSEERSPIDWSSTDKTVFEVDFDELLELPLDEF